jgi:hypothetical protein
VKVDDTDVINFLLSTEIIPLCLRTMVGLYNLNPVDPVASKHPVSTSLKALLSSTIPWFQLA